MMMVMLLTHDEGHDLEGVSRQDRIEESLISILNRVKEDVLL
jgi:hypothetical protein